MRGAVMTGEDWLSLALTVAVMAIGGTCLFHAYHPVLAVVAALAFLLVAGLAVATRRR